MTVRDVAADLAFSAVMALTAWAIILLTRWDTFYVLTIAIFGGHVLRAAIGHLRNSRDHSSEDPAFGRSEHTGA